MNTGIRVAVGLSGGVDSAVVAALLHREGYDVVGLTMKIWKGGLPVVEGARHGCFGPGEDEDIAVSERLCSQLGIPYRVVDLSEDYERLVLDYFRREYRLGRTPNPCIVCNREMKFGFLLERARASGLEFDAFATGHYARIVEREGVRYLARARSQDKDQSYFLYTLDSELLGGVRFPLGELEKAEVRNLARSLGLEVAEKAESQDFIAGGDYAPLFSDSPPEPGDFVDREGRVLGKHRGLPYYTVGQRRGLGLALDSDPLYVLRLDAAANRVVVGRGDGLFVEGLEVDSFHFQDSRLARTEFSAFAKIRLAHRPAACRVRPTEGGGARLVFEQTQRAVAPGQSAVVYDGEGLVLGGGIIDRALAVAE